MLSALCVVSTGALKIYDDFYCNATILSQYARDFGDLLSLTICGDRFPSLIPSDPLNTLTFSQLRRVHLFSIESFAIFKSLNSLEKIDISGYFDPFTNLNFSHLTNLRKFRIQIDCVGVLFPLLKGLPKCLTELIIRAINFYDYSDLSDSCLDLLCAMKNLRTFGLRMFSRDHNPRVS